MLTQAAQAYIARRDRKDHPDGEFDKGGRWYPSEAEKQPCCRSIRPPSRAWPNSLNSHCRTLKHVARLYGVDEKALRQRVREVEEED